MYLKTSNIAIFSSGSGSNAENLISYFKGNKDINIVAIFTNHPHAGVIERGLRLQVPVEVFDKITFQDEAKFLSMLKKYEVNGIVLAGFLWLIPPYLIKKYEQRIVNIHPALLPKFGGKGMYGMNVHFRVKAEEETETGITIHYVNEEYDKGDVIFQAKCEVIPEDSPDDIAYKVHQLEYKHFPRVVKELFSPDARI